MSRQRHKKRRSSTFTTASSMDEAAAIKGHVSADRNTSSENIIRKFWH